MRASATARRRWNKTLCQDRGPATRRRGLGLLPSKLAIWANRFGTFLTGKGVTMDTGDHQNESGYEKYQVRVKRGKSRTVSRIAMIGMFLSAALLYFLPSGMVYRAIAFVPVFLLIYFLGQEAASGATRRMRDQAEMLLASARNSLDQWQEGASQNGEVWRESRKARQIQSELGWFRSWCDAVVLRAAAKTGSGRFIRGTLTMVFGGSCVYLVLEAIDHLVEITEGTTFHVLPVLVAIILGVATLTAMVEVVVGTVAIHKYRAGLRIMTKLDTLDRIGRMKEREIEKELHEFAEAIDQLTGRGSSQSTRREPL